MSTDRKTQEQAEGSWIFTVNYTPSIAQISIKGKVQITSEPKEIEKILEDWKKQIYPTQIMQAIASIAIAEGILIAKTLGAPPPIPPLPIPPSTQPQPKTSSPSLYR